MLAACGRPPIAPASWVRMPRVSCPLRLATSGTCVAPWEQVSQCKYYQSMLHFPKSNHTCTCARVTLNPPRIPVTVRRDILECLPLICFLSLFLTVDPSMALAASWKHALSCPWLVTLLPLVYSSEDALLSPWAEDETPRWTLVFSSEVPGSQALSVRASWLNDTNGILLSF